MLTSYSQESSFEQAFRETFGGDRPCELCKIIEETDSENTQAPSSQQVENRELKLMLGIGRQLRISCEGPKESVLTPYRKGPLEAFYKQPTPPPRLNT